jgi:agmatine deiminase
MINDNSTDQLYLSGLLPERFPNFYRQFEEILLKYKIQFSLLSHTNDIWCRDYMPIQNGLGQLIRFQYTPDYLKGKKYQSILTNALRVCQKLDLETVKNDLIVDGGNVVHYGNKVIMCDKVLNENKQYSKKEIIEKLRWALRVNHVLLIPTHPEDLFGHADGILRFINQRTVLVSDYSKECPAYWKALTNELKKYKLDIVKLPCNTLKNKNTFDATGIYINFLQMKNIIFYPIFGLPEDIKVEKLLNKLLPKSKIIPVESREIAQQGGVLNCISWNILSNYPKERSEYEKEVDRDLMSMVWDERYL